jgi:hypothetical protein
MRTTRGTDSIVMYMALGKSAGRLHHGQSAGSSSPFHSKLLEIPNEPGKCGILEGLGEQERITRFHMCARELSTRIPAPGGSEPRLWRGRGS